jgi:superfamily II DNA or RNA helicase
MTELRPYQVTGVDEFFQACERYRRILLVAPTGSGKTVVYSAIIKRFTSELKNVLVIAHTREIIGQSSQTLKDHNIAHGIIMAGVEGRPLERVQVGTIQTISTRTRTGRLELPPANLVFIDEAHRAPAATYQAVIDAYPNAVILGATATPCRGDGRGLGGIFETMVLLPQVKELIGLGYLVPTVVYAPPPPNLKGIKVQAGDYHEGQLAERMDNPKLIGDIVTHWLKYGERRKTIAFAVNVAHSVHLKDEFIKSGVRAGHIDGSTPKDERAATLEMLRAGEIEVLCNCMVLTEGWDMPEVSCCILARPTRKKGMYMQMGGRVLRPADGKTNAIILDHAGAVHRHGLLEDPVEWTLNPDKRATTPLHEARLRDSASRLCDCAQCGALREAGKPCFHCGFFPKRAGRGIAIGDGDLGLVDRDRKVSIPQVDRNDWHAQFAYIAAERGYKPGWVSHKYKERFGSWPPWGSTPAPRTPTREVRMWLKSRAIAYHKARGAA